MIGLKKRKKHTYVVYIPLRLVKPNTGRPYYGLNDQEDVRELVAHHFKISTIAEQNDFPTIIEECLTSTDCRLRQAALKHLKQSQDGVKP